MSHADSKWSHVTVPIDGRTALLYFIGPVGLHTAYISGHLYRVAREVNPLWLLTSLNKTLICMVSAGVLDRLAQKNNQLLIK